MVGAFLGDSVDDGHNHSLSMVRRIDWSRHHVRRSEGYANETNEGTRGLYRGAILRKLLELFHSRMYWWAIVLSALLFGVVHGNMAQGLHAFLLGLLLGWMYWRTNSIVPGIVLHWINNTVAFVLYNLIPGAEDARLVDIFGGDQRSVYLALAFSLCIFLPSLYQLTIRLKKEES